MNDNTQRVRGSTSKAFPLYVVKRLDSNSKHAWTVRIVGILLAFLLAGIMCTIFRPGTFGTFYVEMFGGCFESSYFMDFLVCVSFYIIMALALTPAFKMKFWNIGGEGQTLISCLTCAGIIYFMPKSVGDGPLILLCLVAGIASGIIWAVIPAIFKAIFNTNETLFTLMMNYVAMGLVTLMISIWITNGSQVFPYLYRGSIEDLFGVKYLVIVIAAVLIILFMLYYLKKSKHGYELSVVGESVNTARYVGINVKKVIIRTIILSGAICGFLGFLLVCGVEHTVNENLVGGRGFTGVLIAWLGHFNPLEIVLYSFLVGIFFQGSKRAATTIGMASKQFSAITTGIFFLVIIAFEFFVSYQVLARKNEEGEIANTFIRKVNNGWIGFKVFISPATNKIKSGCSKVGNVIKSPFVKLKAKIVAFKNSKKKGEDE